jgi:glycosyltransferase involved in cell wall biosynthesis
MAIEGWTGLHVFVIPSWVSGVSEPSAGSFMLEQAQAVARPHPDWTVTFSAVNHHVPTTRLITLRKVLTLLSARSSATPMALPTGFVHCKRHVLLRRSKLLKGDIAPIVAAHRRHLMAQQERPDLLHAHVAWPAGAAARALSREFGIPYIVTEHMAPFPLPGRPLTDAAGRATRIVLEPLEDADAVIAVSDYLAAAMREQGLHRPVTVIPNGVDTEFFHPPIDMPAGHPFTFLTVSRLTDEKGIADLLQAIEGFHRIGGRARFRIAGPGPRALYEQMAEQLGIAGSVRFLGPLGRAEIAAELRAAQALVMPARHESFGIVAIEAMATGIPVLATRSGGPESIVTAKTGLLVEAAAPGELARGLAAMMSRAGEFDREIILARCRSRYGADIVAAQVAALYREVLARRP